MKLPILVTVALAATASALPSNEQQQQQQQQHTPTKLVAPPVPKVPGKTVPAFGKNAPQQHQQQHQQHAAPCKHHQHGPCQHNQQHNQQQPKAKTVFAKHSEKLAKRSPQYPANVFAASYMYPDRFGYDDFYGFGQEESAAGSETANGRLSKRQFGGYYPYMGYGYGGFGMPYGGIPLSLGQPLLPPARNPHGISASLNFWGGNDDETATAAADDDDSETHSLAKRHFGFPGYGWGGMGWGMGGFGYPGFGAYPGMGFGYPFGRFGHGYDWSDMWGFGAEDAANDDAATSSSTSAAPVTTHV